MITVRWRSIVPGSGYELLDGSTTPPTWAYVDTPFVDDHIERGGVVRWEPPAGARAR